MSRYDRGHSRRGQRRGGRHLGDRVVVGSRQTATDEVSGDLTSDNTTHSAIIATNRYVSRPDNHGHWDPRGRGYGGDAWRGAGPVSVSRGGWYDRGSERGRGGISEEWQASESSWSTRGSGREGPRESNVRRPWHTRGGHNAFDSRTSAGGWNSTPNTWATVAGRGVVGGTRGVFPGSWGSSERGRPKVRGRSLHPFDQTGVSVSPTVAGYGEAATGDWTTINRRDPVGGQRDRSARRTRPLGYTTRGAEEVLDRARRTLEMTADMPRRSGSGYEEPTHSGLNWRGSPRGRRGRSYRARGTGRGLSHSEVATEVESTAEELQRQRRCADCEGEGFQVCEFYAGSGSRACETCADRAAANLMRLSAGVTIGSMLSCPTCNESGEAPCFGCLGITTQPCWECDGTGQTIDSSSSESDNVSEEEIPGYAFE